jgi:hypothetical protein
MMLSAAGSFVAKGPTVLNRPDDGDRTVIIAPITLLPNIVLAVCVLPSLLGFIVDATAAFPCSAAICKCSGKEETNDPPMTRQMRSPSQYNSVSPVPHDAVVTVWVAVLVNVLVEVLVNVLVEVLVTVLVAVLVAVCDAVDVAVLVSVVVS